MTKWKEYLGDAVYVDIGGGPGEIVLTTENGVEETNRIVLDDAVHRALTRWLQRLVAAAEAEGDDV